MPPPKKTKIRLPGEKKDRTLYQTQEGGFYIKKGGKKINIETEGGNPFSKFLQFCGLGDTECQKQVIDPIPIPRPTTTRATTRTLPQAVLKCTTPGGTYGCFIANGNTLVNYLESYLQNTTDPRKAPDYLSQIRQRGFKIYYEETDYETEVTILEKLLAAGMTPDELNLSPIIYQEDPSQVDTTTIINDSFNIPTILTVPHSNGTFTQPLTSISIVYFTPCKKDLTVQSIRNNEYVPDIIYDYFIADIIPTILKLHSIGYVHKDIKPANIIVCDNKYKLIDFGLVCHKSDTNCLNEVLTSASYTLPFILNKEIELYKSSQPGTDRYKVITNAKKFIPNLVEYYGEMGIEEQFYINSQTTIPSTTLITSPDLWLRNDWYALSVTIYELFLKKRFKLDPKPNLNDNIRKLNERIREDIVFLSSPEVLDKEKFATHFGTRIPSQQGGKYKKTHSNKN